MIIATATKKIEVNDGDTIRFDAPVLVLGKPQTDFKVIFAGRKPTFILGKRSVKIEDWRERSFTVVIDEHTNVEVERKMKAYLKTPTADGYNKLNNALLLHLAKSQV